MSNKIIQISIEDLYANSYNSNKMPEIKFEALMDTIKRYGQTHPIQVVQDKEGKYRIIGGEHRWRAMKLLRFKTVDVLVREFEDEIDEKLASVEDNLSGNPIPIKEAMIVAQATKKYKLKDLQKRMGQTEPELKDRLLLAGENEKLEKLQEDLEKDHLVELDFVVDAEAKENAEAFAKSIAEVAKKMGARNIQTNVKMSKTKDPVGFMSFNVSDLQKNVIEQAIQTVISTEEVSKGKALELIAADYLAGAPLPKKGKKLSTSKVEKLGKKR